MMFKWMELLGDITDWKMIKAKNLPKHTSEKRKRKEKEKKMEKKKEKKKKNEVI